MVHRLYCLRCFATLPRGTAKGTECGYCGHLFRPRERKTYWNLSPVARRLEGTLKFLAVVMTFVLTFLIVINVGHLGRVAVFAVAGPICLGTLLWRTASTLTRHETNWSPSVVWAALFALLATAFTLAESNGLGSVPPMPVLVVGAAMFSLALGSLLAGRLFRWWRSALMTGDQRDGDSSVTDSFESA